ncbi:MAG: HEAT repeat domain-containing protein [Chloroflexota bacterium]
MSPFGLFGPPDVGKLKAKRDVAGLIRATAYRQKDVGIAEAAIHALGELGDPRAIEPLFALLDARHWQPDRLRSAAFSALARFENAPIESFVGRLAEKDGSARRAALAMLRQVTDPGAVPWLISLLGNQAAGVDAAKALAKIGEPALAPLIAALASPKDSVRCATARALGGLGDRRAVSSLLDRLGDPEQRVISAAAEAVGQMGDPEAVEPLVAVLARRELDQYTRGAAAKALGAIGDPRAVGGLVAALREEHRWLQDCAGRALVEFGPLAVSPLVAMLDEVQGTPRVAAAKVLVTLYRDGKLSDACKQEILAVRGTLSKAHVDWSTGECSIHHDIGVKGDLEFRCG